MLDNFRRQLAKAIAPDQTFNPFNRAFYSLVGNGYTSYDESAPTYLNKGYGTNPDVYAVIQQMTTKTTSVPYSIRKVKEKGQKHKYDQLRMTTKGLYSPGQLVQRMSYEEKAFIPEDFEMPLERPNPLQTWSDIWALYKTYIRTTGNFYLYLLSPEEGANAGEPLQVYVLPAHQMHIVLKPNADLLGVESPVDHYKLIEGNMYVDFKAENVIHVKLPNPFYDQNGSHLYGLSPLKAALKNIEISNEALKLNSKTMQNAGAFGFIHAKGTPLSPEQADSLKDRMVEMDANPAKFSNIAGSSAELGFTRISLTTEELKPFEYLKNDQKAICNVLGWSDKLLNNDDGGKYDNVSQFRQQVITDNIMPDLKLLEDSLNTEFLPRFRKFQGACIEWDVSALPEMQVDMAELMAWIKDAISSGVINRDTARKYLKLPPVESKEMEAYTVDSTVMTLEDALLPDFPIDSN